MFTSNISGVTQTMAMAISAAAQANDYDLAFKWAVALVFFSLLFVVIMNLFTSKSK